ncbi:MAG TPA: MFS transporter [Chloroflexota bacterium]|nr:MFS transporter [Chloroflexota bacterium]
MLGYPIGRWVDRNGARAVLASGAVLAGLTLIGLSRVDQFWGWLLLWGGGLGAAGAMTQYPVTFTVVANWFHRRRGSALALLTVLGGLASPIFIPLAGWLVPQVGWRETLLLFGLTHLCIALPLALVLVRRHPEDVGLFPDGAPSAEEAATTPMTGVGVQRAVRRVPFWTLTLTNVVALLGSNVLYAHQVAYMIDRGQDPGVAATLAGMVGIASLPGRYLFNVMSDRFEPQVLLGFSQAVLALGVALLALADSTGWLIAYAVVYGSAFGTSGGLTASVRAAHFGRRAFGAISALQGYPGLGGAALGPLLAGWLYDHSGTYQVSLAVVATLYVVSAAAMFLTPRPGRTRW